MTPPLDFTRFPSKRRAYATLGPMFLSGLIPPYRLIRFRRSYVLSYKA